MIKSPDWNWYYEQLQGATLEVIERGKQVQTFLLRKYPDSSNMSTWLFFTPVAIILTGDLRITHHGIIANGYDLGWFSDKLYPTYLAEKFLETQWVPEQAHEHCEECLAEWKRVQVEWQAAVDQERAEYEADDIEFVEPTPDEPYLEKKLWSVCGEELEDATIIDALEVLLSEHNEGYFSSANELYEALPSYKGDDDSFWHSPFTSEDLGGYGYAPGEVGWLSAIQRRFSDLYWALPAQSTVSEKTL